MAKVHHGGSSRWFITTVLAMVLTPALLAQRPLGIGRAATPEEIKKLDIDVRPDGKGLPEGKGTVADGA